MAGSALVVADRRWLDAETLVRAFGAGVAAFAVGGLVRMMTGPPGLVVALLAGWCGFVAVYALLVRRALLRGTSISLASSTVAAGLVAAVGQAVAGVLQLSADSSSSTSALWPVILVVWPAVVGVVFAGAGNVAARIGLRAVR